MGRIFALQGGGLKSYSGNYSAYFNRFQQEQIELARAYRQRQELLARESRLIRESKADQRSKRQARSRQKRLDKLEAVQRPPEERSFKVGFEYSGRGSDLVIAFEAVTKSFGGKTLFKDLHFEIRRGERVALVGPNGAGKSTLLKMIAGEIKPSAGKIKLGPAVKTVYFSQEQEQLDPGRTLVEEITAASDLDLKEARNHLAAYLFKGDEVFKKVSDLSGGEKSRLALARLALSGGNCLLMDEPTSHLDLPALESWRKAAGPGTFGLFRRYFLNGLTNRVIAQDGAVSLLRADSGIPAGQGGAFRTGGSRCRPKGGAAFGWNRRSGNGGAAAGKRTERLEAQISGLKRRSPAWSAPGGSERGDDYNYLSSLGLS